MRWLFCAVLSACASAPGERSPASTPAREASEQLKEACTPSEPETCFNASDDNCNGIIDEGCGVPTGLLQFVIAWDKASSDIDLLVTDPGGELVEVGRLAKSGLVKERDCPGRRGECRGVNVENVFLEGNKPIQHGRFQVRIRLEKLGDEEPPVRVNFGARLGPKTHAEHFVLERNEQEKNLSFEL